MYNANGYAKYSAGFMVDGQAVMLDGVSFIHPIQSELDTHGHIMINFLTQIKHQYKCQELEGIDLRDHKALEQITSFDVSALNKLAHEISQELLSTNSAFLKREEDTIIFHGGVQGKYALVNVWMEDRASRDEILRKSDEVDKCFPQDHDEIFAA